MEIEQKFDGNSAKLKKQKKNERKKVQLESNFDIFFQKSLQKDIKKLAKIIKGFVDQIFLRILTEILCEGPYI